MDSSRVAIIPNGASEETDVLTRLLKSNEFRNVARYPSQLSSISKNKSLFESFGTKPEWFNAVFQTIVSLSEVNRVGQRAT